MRHIGLTFYLGITAAASCWVENGASVELAALPLVQNREEIFESSNPEKNIRDSKTRIFFFFFVIRIFKF